MMPRAPTPAERRTIIVSLALALLVLVAVRVLPAWRAHAEELRSSAVEVRAELAAAEASIAALPWLRDSLVVRRERYLALAPRLLTGESPGAAAASLASLVSGAAQGARMRVGSSRVRTDTAAAAGFARVRVEVELTGDIHGLTALLRMLERGPQLLRVDRLSVTQPEPAGPADSPESLRVELAVEGVAITRRTSADQEGSR